MLGLVPLPAYYALVYIFVLLSVAELLGASLERAGLPAIIGEVLAGIALGTFAIGGLINQYVLQGTQVFVLTPEVLLFADFSIILVVFAAGLEGGLGSFRAAGPTAVAAAIGGDLVSFGLAALTLRFLFDLSMAASLLGGVAVAATSTAAVAYMLRRESVAGTPGGRYLLSVSAMDDVAGLVIFSVVIAFLGGSVGLSGLTGSIGIGLAALAVVLLLSIAGVRLLFRSRAARESRVIPLLVLFMTVTTVVVLGFSGIIGAFIAGLAMAGSMVSARVREMSDYLLAIFGSLFFAVLGAQFDVRLLFDPTQLPRLLELTGALLAVAWVGKVVIIAPITRLHFRSWKVALSVAVGAVPRGEIGLLIGTVGFVGGYFGASLFGALVLVALITTITGSLGFHRLVRPDVPPVSAPVAPA
jgi:Na+:H+ antiporter